MLFAPENWVPPRPAMVYNTWLGWDADNRQTILGFRKGTTINNLFMKGNQISTCKAMSSKDSQINPFVLVSEWYRTTDFDSRAISFLIKLQQLISVQCSSTSILTKGKVENTLINASTRHLHLMLWKLW